MCGGTASESSTKRMVRGLSPRVRGNPAIGAAFTFQNRSIPACAGEPPARCRRAAFGGVYPRVCGGTRLAIRHTLGSSGLSPRVRGNPRTKAEEIFNARSIPACAGEPVSNSVFASAARVYPRVCGGTSLAVSSIPLAAGLSPRVRGNLGLSRLPILLAWSIPACAGEPVFSRLYVC